MSQSNHFPTALEIAETISDLTDEQLYDVFCGKKSILEDPRNQRMVVRDTAKLNPEEFKQRVDIGKHLSAFIAGEVPDLVPRIADAVRMGVQMAPQLLAEARNEVRRNLQMPSMVEAAMIEGPITAQGRVTAQNERQTVITDNKGLHSYLLDNALLSAVPKRDSTVRIERKAEGGRFDVKELTLGRDSNSGLAR